MLHERPFMGRCDRCLASSPILEVADRAAARARLDELLWELCADGQTWCLDCSRGAREVQPRRRRRK